jgi:hypothetical protein
MDRRFSTMLSFGKKRRQEKEIEEMLQRQREREQEERVQALERRLNEEQKLREKHELDRARVEAERIRDEGIRRQEDSERQNQLRQADWNRQEAVRVQNAALEAARREKVMLEQEAAARRVKKAEDKRKRLRMTNTETLRELRELIRIRYELDVKIWSLRKVRKPDRPMIEEDMERADALMAEIMEIIRAWEGSEAWWSKNEWEQVEQIIDKMNADGKRRWMGNAPWEED